MGKRGIIGRFLRDKRGVSEEVLVEAMQALAVMLILIGNLAYVDSKFEKVGFAKPFYARDIGLMLTTLPMGTGNIYYFYDVQPFTEKNTQYLFHIIMSDRLIYVNATNSPKQSFYWYFEDYALDSLKLDEANFGGMLTLAKEGTAMKGGRQVSTNIYSIPCPAVSTRSGGWLSNKIIIDPSHFETREDKGAVSSTDAGFYEADITSTIANRISLQNKILTKTADELASIEKRKAAVDKEGTDVPVVSIHIGSYADSKKNYIKAYYNINSDEITKLKSRKLGCSILNSILFFQKLEGKEKINGVMVLPSDSEYINSIIPAGRVGVMLELGNIEFAKKDNFLADATDLAAAIVDGIGEYYKK